MELLFERELNDYYSYDAQKRKETLDRIIQFLKSKTVVVYGAGNWGEMVNIGLTSAGVKINAYLDKRQGADFLTFYGVEVVHPEDIGKFNDPSVVILMAISPKIVLSANDEPRQLTETLAPNAKLINNPAVLTFMLMNRYCAERRNNNEPISLMNCQRCGGLDDVDCEVFRSYLREIALPVRKHDKSGYKSASFDWFGYIVGQKCSLNCRLCCEMIPQVHEGVFIDKDTILNDCRKIVSSCEFIRYIEIIGGEPLLHPELPEILEELLLIENVGFIRMFTNGTVPISDKLFEIIKNERFVLMFSNYLNQVSGNQHATILENRRKLEEHNVKYMFIRGDIWSDFGLPERRNQLEEILKFRFDACYLRNCHRVFNGKLYQCPRNYCLHEVVQANPDDDSAIYIHRHNEEALARELDDFERREYTDICDYCLAPFDGESFPAGEQE